MKISELESTFVEIFGDMNRGIYELSSIWLLESPAIKKNQHSLTSSNSKIQQFSSSERVNNLFKLSPITGAKIYRKNLLEGKIEEQSVIGGEFLNGFFEHSDKFSFPISKNNNLEVGFDLDRARILRDRTTSWFTDQYPDASKILILSQTNLEWIFNQTDPFSVFQLSQVVNESIKKSDPIWISFVFSDTNYCLSVFSAKTGTVTNLISGKLSQFDSISKTLISPEWWLLFKVPVGVLIIAALLTFLAFTIKASIAAGTISVWAYLTLNAAASLGALSTYLALISALLYFIIDYLKEIFSLIPPTSNNKPSLQNAINRIEILETNLKVHQQKIEQMQSSTVYKIQTTQEALKDSSAAIDSVIDGINIANTATNDILDVEQKKSAKAGVSDINSKLNLVEPFIPKPPN